MKTAFTIHLMAIFLALFFTQNSHAGMAWYDSSDVHLGVFSEGKCDTELTCSESSGKLLVQLSGLQDQINTTGATTLTASQCGSTVISGGAHTVTLPEASTVLGCRYSFIVGNATALTIDPADGTDQIVLLTNAGGDSLVADAIGESVVLEAIEDDSWAPVGSEKGTWTDSD